MENSWPKLPFSSAVEVNPTVKLTRGVVYPFVEMAAIEPGFPFVYASELRPFNGSGSRFCSGDTLMARITPSLENGKIARYQGTESPAYGSTEFIVLRGRDGVTTSDYAYYLTCWQDVHTYAVSQMTGTSGRQRVPVSAFGHILVPVPPLSAQEQIVAILRVLDDKIELNRRMSETLEKIAGAIFTEWQAENGRHSPSVVGSHLADIIDFNPPERLPKGTKQPYLGLAELPTMGMVHQPPMLRPYTSGARFRDGDTLFARITPSLENGKAALVNGLGQGAVGWGSTELIVMRPKSPVPTIVPYLIARDSAFRAHAIQNMTGTSGRQRVPTAALEQFPFVAFTHEAWATLDSRIGPIASSIWVRALESRTLAELRDTLLPKLISGELRIPDAEKLVSEVP